MKNFTETMTTANKELNWFISKAQVIAQDSDCITKKFVGKVAHALAFKAIKGNNWDNVNEGGQGKGSYWMAQSMNAGLYLNTYTGIVEFTFYEAK